MMNILNFRFNMENFPAWNEIVKWFLALPIHFQILIIIGIFLIVAISLVLVYYILKGLFYLLKEVFKGIKKLLTNLYYAISGKTKPVESVYINQKTSNQEENQEYQINSELKTNRQLSEIQFCSECGNQITNKMQKKLNETGIVYCVFCGNKINK